SLFVVGVFLRDVAFRSGGTFRQEVLELLDLVAVVIDDRQERAVLRFREHESASFHISIHVCWFTWWPWSEPGLERDRTSLIQAEMGPERNRMPLLRHLHSIPEGAGRHLKERYPRLGLSLFVDHRQVAPLLRGDVPVTDRDVAGPHHVGPSQEQDLEPA